jgi:predicted nucleic acid-binding protein
VGPCRTGSASSAGSARSIELLIVIDASAAVQLAASASSFGALAGYELIAPPLLWSEGPSAIHQALARHALERSDAEETLARLLAAPIKARRPAELIKRAWSIADAFGWAKMYDAEYVALAELADCPLLTTDFRLARTAATRIRILEAPTG